MGAEHSQILTTARPTQHADARTASAPVSWKAMALGVQYSATDVAVWPQCLPLLLWFTEQDAVALHEKLQRRTRTRFVTVDEFRAWLSNGADDASTTTLRPLAMPAVPTDIMTPPAVAHKLRDAASQQTPPPQSLSSASASAPLVLDRYLDHVFATFTRGGGGGTKIYALEFLAAMVLGSRAIWRVDDKCRVLLTLFQDAANASTLGDKQHKEPIFKEADLAQLFLCAMQGVAKLTVGVQSVWLRHGLVAATLARRFAADGIAFALARRTDNQVGLRSSKTVVTARELRAFVDATPAAHRFLALFSGEEMRNPFTFGVARSPCDGLFYPSRYRAALDQQRLQYDALLQRHVSVDGRAARRRESAAMLIQSTWRRRCSRSLLERKRTAQQRQRHASAAMLQGFLRQCQFAKVLEQHAEAEANALNGGVLVAGQGPCVPASSVTAPSPLKLVETFKLLNVKIRAVTMSRTCALALQDDAQTLFAWGRCLPRVYADGGADAVVTLTQGTPARLAFRFPVHARVTQLACGLSHALVVTDDGNVHSWGFNDHGQLGHGSAATLLARSSGQATYAAHYDERDGREYEYLPQPTKLVYFQGAAQQQAEPIPIERVVCGDYYSMALSRAGDVFTWGEASEGQLGHGDAHASFQVAFVDRHMLNSAYTFLSEPEPVLALSDRRVIQIACKKNHSVALTDESRVFEWGNWGKRLGHDAEHAFEPVEVDARLVAPLRLRQLSVGDHHTLAEGSSVWLTIPGRADGLRGERRVYLACSPTLSCDQDVVERQFTGRKWTCVLVDCDVDDIEIDDEPRRPASETVAEAAVDAPSLDNRALWTKRAEAYRLSEASQFETFDARFAHVFHCFPGLARKFGFERMLMLWLHGHVQNRLVVMPRGKPAGFFLQIVLLRDAADEAERRLVAESELEAPHTAGLPPVAEFAVCGSSTATHKPTKAGFATHFFHPAMRARLAALPRRLRKVMPTDFMEPNSIFIVEFNESSCDAAETSEGGRAETVGGDDRDDGDAASRFFTRSSTPDGKHVFEWSELVVQAMVRRVLAVQEAGALAVLVVLDFLDADAFELELAEDSGVYIPVFMVQKAAVASRSPETCSRRLVFGEVLDQFLAAQVFEEPADPDEPPPVPPAWAVRVFERVDTTQARIQSALANGAAGVVLVQDDQSVEMDGETRGAPIFLDTPPLAAAPKKPAEHLVAMISHEASSVLRAASALALTTRAMPFVKSDATCELLVDVGIEIRPGGTLYAWGNGQNGRLGLGNPAFGPLEDGYEALTDSPYRYTDRPTPVVALAGHELKELVCGSAHTVAVTEQGRVFTWGKGARGELANARTREQAARLAQDQWVPRMLHHLRYDRIVSAAANDAATALLSELVDAEVYLERRKEVLQLKAAARKSLLP